MTKSWTDLLTEPLAILGAYEHQPPPLSSFAPHSVRIHYDNVLLAGQFMELPKKLPETWLYGGVARAYVIFRLNVVRELKIEGVLRPAAEDDSMHGVDVGEVSTCQLEEHSAYLKRLTLKTSSFNLLVESDFVSVICGRNARPRDD